MRTTLNKIGAGLALGLLAAGGLGADEAPGPVAELRETIGRLVEVKAQTSEEQAAWEEQRESMKRLLELHQRELALLDEELEQAGQAAGGYAEQKAEAEEAIAAFRAVRQQTAEVVAGTRPRVLALTGAFPAPLAAEVAGERAQLEAWQAGDEPREGLQAILGIIAQAEQFNRSVRRSREERDGREVEVLYLGLARAYYVGPGGVAGIGEPGLTGWTWTERPGLADPVRNALAQLDRKRSPELVPLPVEIKEVGR